MLTSRQTGLRGIDVRSLHQVPNGELDVALNSIPLDIVGSLEYVSVRRISRHFARGTHIPLRVDVIEALIVHILKKKSSGCVTVSQIHTLKE